jgi:hypothetical protein
VQILRGGNVVAPFHRCTALHEMQCNEVQWGLARPAAMMQSAMRRRRTVRPCPFTADGSALAASRITREPPRSQEGVCGLPGLVAHSRYLDSNIPVRRCQGRSNAVGQVVGPPGPLPGSLTPDPGGLGSVGIGPGEPSGRVRLQKRHGPAPTPTAATNDLATSLAVWPPCLPRRNEGHICWRTGELACGWRQYLMIRYHYPMSAIAQGSDTPARLACWRVAPRHGKGRDAPVMGPSQGTVKALWTPFPDKRQRPGDCLAGPPCFRSLSEVVTSQARRRAAGLVPAGMNPAACPIALS